MGDSVAKQGGKWKDGLECSCPGPSDSSSLFWPSVVKTQSAKGVVMHTHEATNVAWRVPVSLFAVKPASWHVVADMVTWYCNGDCTDGGSAGGCSARDGGIMDWKDDHNDDSAFRSCLLDSVEKQGGKFKDGVFCTPACSGTSEDSTQFWPSVVKTPSAAGVVIHTHDAT